MAGVNVFIKKEEIFHFSGQAQSSILLLCVPVPDYIFFSLPDGHFIMHLSGF